MQHRKVGIFVLGALGPDTQEFTRVLGFKGKLLEFSRMPTPTHTGIAYVPCAIVERADGTVSAHLPRDIQFLEPALPLSPKELR
jgi:hypothetical protein